ncbi:MAG: hypothetical protein QMD92_05370 [bacterium]|nr:hypothetical protein [bacterium]
MNNLQKLFIILIIIFFTSCGYIKSVTIVRTIPPTLNINHINRVAVVPFTEHKSYQDSAQRIASMVMSIFIETNKFQVLTKQETKKIYSYFVQNPKSLEDSKTIIELCKTYGIDAIFLVKLAKFQEDTFINTNFDSYYSPKENRYITYAIEEDGYIISLDALFRLSEGSTGKVLWEKKEDLNVSQTSPRTGFFRKSNENQLLQSLISKSIQSLLKEISPQKKLIKRKVVLE